MRQVEIMYNNLLGLLNCILESPDNETFALGLDEAKAEEFVTLLNTMEFEYNNIQDAQRTESLFPNYDGIKAVIEKFTTDFPTYIVQRKKEIIGIIEISKILSDLLVDLTNSSFIDGTGWELVEIESSFQIPQNFYSYFNNASNEDSIIYFNLTHLNELELDSTAGNFNLQIKMSFILLSKIGDPANTLNSDRFALIKAGRSSFMNRIYAFLSMHLVSDGLYIHFPKAYTITPSKLWKDDIRLDNKYQQFDDIFHVISEYNHNQDVLNKYLKIYQVVEEYMYKYQLVKLEREMGGRLFSLRDFKRMNEDVAEKEALALKNFIALVFALEISSGTSFKSYCFTKWSNLSATMPASDLDNVLSRFRVKTKTGITYTNASIRIDDTITIFCQLVYSIRNSIVHNKSTEFHLTYKSLVPTIASVIENYLIHMLELIVLKLTIDPSSEVVWFQGTELKIWNDN